MPPILTLMSDHQRRVAEFMARGGQALPDDPGVPAAFDLARQLRMLWEELAELTAACGFVVRTSMASAGECYLVDPFVPSAQAVPARLDFLAVAPPLLPKIADGLADVHVVTTGTMLTCGLPDLPLLREVDDSNLSKFGPGWYVDTHGKVIKSPHYRPADFGAVIARVRDAAGPVAVRPHAQEDASHDGPSRVSGPPPGG